MNQERVASNDKDNDNDKDKRSGNLSEGVSESDAIVISTEGVSESTSEDMSESYLPICQHRILHVATSSLGTWYSYVKCVDKLGLG